MFNISGWMAKLASGGERSRADRPAEEPLTGPSVDEASFANMLAMRNRLIDALQRAGAKPPTPHGSWSEYLSDRLAVHEHEHSPEEALRLVVEELRARLPNAN